jgi:hypothetical protein
MGDVGQLDLRQDQVDKIPRHSGLKLNPERQVAVRKQRKGPDRLDSSH